MSNLFKDLHLRQYAWYYATRNSPYGNKPVAQLLANDYGVYDMSGSVWEWVHDYYGTYATGPVTDPVTTLGSNRVRRGGDWFMNPNNVRSAQRNNYTPTFRDGNFGFRIGFTP